MGFTNPKELAITGGLPVGYEFFKSGYESIKEGLNPKIPESSESTATQDDTAMKAAAAEAAEAEAARLRRRRGMKATIVTGDMGGKRQTEKAEALG
jgi:hypothetical protein